MNANPMHYFLFEGGGAALYRLNGEVFEFWDDAVSHDWQKSVCYKDPCHAGMRMISEEDARHRFPEAFPSSDELLGRVKVLEDYVHELDNCLAKVTGRLDDLSAPAPAPTLNDLFEALRKRAARTGESYNNVILFKDGSGYLRNSVDQDICLFSPGGKSIIEVINEH